MDRLVNKSDIAKTLGVGKAAVSNWMARHKDFPTPLVVCGTEVTVGSNTYEVGSNTNLFSLDEVQVWHEIRSARDRERELANAQKAYDEAKERLRRAKARQ